MPPERGRGAAAVKRLSAPVTRKARTDRRQGLRNIVGEVLLMPGTTKSVVVVRPQRMETWEFPLPDVGPRDLLLKVEMVGICGSEPKKYMGKRAARKWSASIYDL